MQPIDEITHARQLAPRVVRQFRAFVRTASAVVAILSGAVAMGYATRTPALIRLYPSFPPMSAMTALALLLMAVAICGQTTRWRKAVTPAAAFAGAWGLVALISTAAVGHDAISPRLQAGLFGASADSRGYTASSTALCLLLLATSFLPAAPRGNRPGGRSDLLAGAALVIATVGLLGYAYGAKDLYAFTPYNAMALHTAFSLCLLSIARLLAKPASGWASVIASELPGGSATRRQLLFLAIPPLIGWGLVQVMLERLMPSATALALLVVLTIVPLALLVLRDGAVLDELESQRLTISDMQAQANSVLETRLAELQVRLDAETAERFALEANRDRTLRLEAMGQLTGGIAHDFNNLLMAVNGNLALIRRRLEEDHPARRHVEHALVATAKGTKVTGQLLAFSRTQRLEIRSVPLDDCLHSAIALVRQAVGHQIEIELDLLPDNGWVSTDPGQFELAVLNLAINARDAMPTGGTLKISTSFRSRMLAGSSAPEACCVMGVADTGSGMAPEIVAKATEPFFTTKPHGQGSGLGLAQAYGFAMQCGGDLRIESEPGRGTTVEIWLRQSAPRSIEPLPAAAAPPRLVAAGGQHVLVIDDDDEVRRVIAEALRQQGYAVSEATNGTSGLARLEEMQPAVAIIDFIMPGMNGAEVARLAQQRHPGLPIIFVSGYSDTLALDGVAGAIVLRKPFDVDGLHQAVVRATLH